MQLLKGQTLKERIAHGPLDTAELLDLAIQIADALDAAHSEGIVHRDIKPANLFATDRGDAKVLDFGLAKTTTSAPSDPDAVTASVGPATDPGTVLGTVGYMSPEQVQGKELDARTDLFSFGAVLYEMATGRQAFKGESAGVIFDQILHKAPTSPVRINPELPDELGQAINKCLEKDRDLRYQHASDLRADLKRLRRDTSSGESVARPGVRVGRGHRLWAWAAVGFGGVVLALGGWLLSNRAPEVPAGAATEPLRITPFTTDGGRKGAPQLSPDGEKVAYAWAGVDDNSFDIYVKALGLGTQPLRLTEYPGGDGLPTWSPDGRRLAFVRLLEEGAAIYTVPSLGGQERKLFDISGPTVLRTDYTVPILSWSPDGEWLAFAEALSKEGPARLVRLSLETLEKQPLSQPPEGTLGDFYPSYSPDGTQLAFVRSGSAAFGGLDVWVQPAGGGEARRLTFGEYDFCEAPAWTAEGDEILFTVGDVAFTILRVSLAGGEPRPVEGVGQNTARTSIRGDRMVYVQLDYQPLDIWRVPGRRAADRDLPPKRLISSTRYDTNPAYSPDGRRIAFTSDRSGVSNIWVCNSDGSDPVQLTSFEHHTGTPRWSPDGRQLVFDSLEAGDRNLYVIDADGGLPRRLTQGPSDDGVGTWSRDGRSIYFNSNRGGSSQIWRIPAEGGEAVQVTRAGGYYGEESWDGRYLYYANHHSTPGIWRVPVGGGDETEVVPAPIGRWGDWALSRSGIYYCTRRARRGRSREYTIHYLDLESGDVTEQFRKEGAFGQLWLAVSPGEEWILFGEVPAWQSELMLVENFR
jgi:Tol biopolymer transport system component